MTEFIARDGVGAAARGVGAPRSVQGPVRRGCRLRVLVCWQRLGGRAKVRPKEVGGRATGPRHSIRSVRNFVGSSVRSAVSTRLPLAQQRKKPTTQSPNE